MQSGARAMTGGHCHHDIYSPSIRPKAWGHLGTSDPHGFTGEFYPTVREEMVPALRNLFQKTAAEGTILHARCDISMTLFPDQAKT